MTDTDTTKTAQELRAAIAQLLASFGYAHHDIRVYAREGMLVMRSTASTEPLEALFQKWFDLLHDDHDLDPEWSGSYCMDVRSGTLLEFVGLDPTGGHTQAVLKRHNGTLCNLPIDGLKRMRRVQRPPGTA